jgi:P pilus assembly chaperone PapD
MKNAWNIISCFMLLVCGAAALGQTVAPPFAEYRGFKAEGSFRVDNNTEQPMLVTLESRRFVVDEKTGKPVFTPLPPTIHVDAGASSFVIPPHDNHTVYYKASSSASSVSFAIMPTMTPVSQTKGVRVNFCIPHMVYLYQKSKLAKSDVTVALVNNQVVISNTSEKLGRVEYIHTKSGDLNGFPIYPGQTRRIEIAGEKATVHFEDGFRLDAR